MPPLKHGKIKLMLDVVVMLSGSGTNLRALLEQADKPAAPYRVVAVLADRQADGLQFAAQRQIPNHVVRPADYPNREAWGAEFARIINEYGVDHQRGLVISAGLMRILPPNFVASFAPRLINTHPALLPNFPGAHAVADALRAGVTETGVTVHHIDDGVDTGQVIAQETVRILPDDTEHTLHERIKTVERVLLPTIVAEIATGRRAL